MLEEYANCFKTNSTHKQTVERLEKNVHKNILLVSVFADTWNGKKR